MKETPYFKQAKLLLRVLPYVDKAGVFALKGGTAINFFLRDMPRLSVDIDLTYVPLNKRKEALKDISKSLHGIATQVRKYLGAQVEEKRNTADDLIIKLIIRNAGATVKVEPNLVLRGTLFPPIKSSIRPKVEEAFNLTVTMTMLDLPDLYGGKICAALDRQHPRDFFDIQQLLDHEGITKEIRKAYIVYLAGHDRPMHELLKPKWKDMRPVFDAEFKGMTLEPVELKQLEAARDKLFKLLHNDLTRPEKDFLITLKEGEPKWDLLGLPGIERLPALQWKLENIRRMSATKRREQAVLLRNALKI